MQTQVKPSPSKVIRVDRDLHRKLKTYCAESEQDMKGILDRLIVVFLSEQEGQA